MSWLTTHMLDTSRGMPATDVAVRCEVERDGVFVEVAHGRTDADGRVRTLFPSGEVVVSGRYRLTFQTGAYFAVQQTPTFFPEVQILFEVDGAQAHYHVPLLVSPFGYTTYRGS